MEINIEIAKYNEKDEINSFQKMNFSSIDEAISYVEFLKLGYDYFKNGEGLVVRAGEGEKPYLLDYNSKIPIIEFRQDLERKFNNAKNQENEFKITEKSQKISLNSNFTFEEDEKTKYVKTTAGEKLPFKLFTPDDTGRRSNLLREPQDSGENLDFALIERRFAENNSIQFFGSEKIKNHDDVAWLFRSLEDESVEHAFLLYDFKDAGYFIQHLSTGTSNSAAIDPKLFIGNIIESQPSSVTLIHNHPSGNLIASMADLQVLENIKKALKNTDVIVNDGIIINLRSGKYLVFNDKDLKDLKQRSSNPRQLQSVQAYSFSKQVLVENFQPIEVKSAADVAAFITSQKFGISDKTEMLVLNSKLHIVGKFILPNNGQESFIVDKLSKYGGSRCVLYGNNITPELVDFYNKRLVLSNLLITDAILFKSENGKKMWESFVVEGKMKDYDTDIYYVSDESQKKFNDMNNTATKNDFVVGNTLIDKYGGFEFTLTNKINDGEWEARGSSGEKMIFENNAHHYLTKAKEVVGQLVFKDTGEIVQFNSEKDYLQSLNNQIDSNMGGFEYKTILRTPEILKKVDALIYGITGDENPNSIEFYKDKIQNESQEIIGGKIKDIAAAALKNPDTLNHYDSNTKDIINLYNNQSISTMENTQKPEKEFNLVNHLQTQLKYLGFGEGEKLHKDLDNGLNGKDQQFSIKTTSDKAMQGNTVDFTINFNKSEKGGVFLNSYEAELKKDNGQSVNQKFWINNTEHNFTAKEAINLLEGRSVKIDFVNPKNNQEEFVFKQLDFQREKNKYGNYEFTDFHQNYGVNTAEIAEKSGLIFDKPEYKENTIKNLEKGNIVAVKFTHDDNVVQGKAVLSPGDRNLKLYDGEMNRLNTNEPIKNLEADQKHEKNNVREQSMSRGI